MDRKLVFLLNNIIDREELLLNEVSIFLDYIYKSKSLYLVHLIHTALDHYSIKTIPSNPRFKIRADYFNGIFFTVFYDDQEFNHIFHNYVQTENFNPNKSFFQFRFSINLVYVGHMNYNGEFVIFDNSLQASINSRKYSDCDRDLSILRSFNKNYKKYLPSYFDIVSAPNLGTNHLI